MLKKGKKRISITVDEENLERVSQYFKDRDYPHGSLSFYLDCCLHSLDTYLEHGFVDPTEDPVLELEVSRIGVKEALKQRGMTFINFTEADFRARHR
jgi:hypothetical protein